MSKRPPLLRFVSTEYLAVVTGIILVVAIQPGSGRSVDGQEALEGAGHMLVVDTVLDIFRLVHLRSRVFLTLQ